MTTKPYEADHREVCSQLPEPLSKRGFWSLVTFALPALQLTVASVVSFVAVLGFLSIGTEADLFVLPHPGALVVSLMGAGLASWIALQCRHRPGRIWPRIWALALVCLNLVIVPLTLLFPDRAWALTLAVAGLAAAATLSLRLVKLRPNSSLVQYIAPLSLLILIVLVPVSCGVRHSIAKATARRVDQRIQQLRFWTADIREISGFEWWRMEDDPVAAGKVVGKLKAMSFAQQMHDAELWRAATILGKDAELAAAVQGLTHEVVAGLSPDRVPRVSDLKEPAIRSDGPRWATYARFMPLSEITGSYHQEMGRLFAELAPQDAPGESPRLADYREHYGDERKALQEHLKESAGTWTDNWAVFRVPNHEELIGLDHAPLKELLLSPFIKSEEGALVPGDVAQLMSLPLARLKELARGASGCEGVENMGKPVGNRPATRAPGCHCQDYADKGRPYFRLDCYSYTPMSAGTGADLRIEMRLVYDTFSPRPKEVFFHFFIPEGVDHKKYSEEVMTDLAAAARQTSHIHSLDKGGSVARGFRVDKGGDSVGVTPPTVETLPGLTPEQWVVKVRVVGPGG